ncbi:Protein of unknown function [Cotesia congregata]|uniref:Uncharacterized protein n=1 Tax=Cotesia congregata TaxID=51543 RepID=A0A8J2HJ64_COTCN|nr:Protein of unknown function [Cotesia congregata]
MGAAAIFVFVLAITAQSIYTYVGLSREGIIEQDKNPEHTSNIGVDINKENSAKESLVSNSHLYHGSSIFGFGHNKKVKQQSEVEVKFYKESHSAKHCSIYSHVGLSRESVIEHDKNPEDTSIIKVDINKENSAKESPVRDYHFYHGLSSFGFGQSKKVQEQSGVEVKLKEEGHPAKTCNIYSHVGLSREGVIEQDQNPEHTSNIEVDINKENSAKASPVSGSHFYHGLSNFGVGENIKVYSHVGLSREGVIEQDKNPEHTSNIKVDDINKENSAKESPVSGSNFYHGSSSFSFGQNKKVEQQSEVEVKFYEESHPVKSCSS